MTQSEPTRRDDGCHLDDKAALLPAGLRGDIGELLGDYGHGAHSCVVLCVKKEGYNWTEAWREMAQTRNIRLEMPASACFSTSTISLKCLRASARRPYHSSLAALMRLARKHAASTDPSAYVERPQTLWRNWNSTWPSPLVSA